MLIDLQLHSTYSDGYLTPTELANYISKQGVKIASLTDHNTVAGLDEFRHACQKLKIKPITGLEFYVKLKHRQFNILWFNFDDTSPELHNVLRDSQMRRRGKIRKILNKLNILGFKIEVEKTLDKYSHYIPLNRVVDDIWKIPHNRKIIKKNLNNQTPREEEIMNRYFHNKEIGRLKNSHINIERIIKLKKKIGGQIIINHPGKYDFLKMRYLQELKKMGIDGLEVLSPHHSYGAVVYAQRIAEQMKFITTGGSDFHRYEEKNKFIHAAWQYYKIDSKLLSGVEKIIGQIKN